MPHSPILVRSHHANDQINMYFTTICREIQTPTTIIAVILCYSLPTDIIAHTYLQTSTCVVKLACNYEFVLLHTFILSAFFQHHLKCQEPGSSLNSPTWSLLMQYSSAGNCHHHHHHHHYHHKNQLHRHSIINSPPPSFCTSLSGLSLSSTTCTRVYFYTYTHIYIYGSYDC